MKKHMAHFKRLFITKIYNVPNTYPSTLPHKRPSMNTNTPSLKSKHSPWRPWKEATPNPNVPAGWQSTYTCQALHPHLQCQIWSLVTCFDLHNGNEIAYSVWIQKISKTCVNIASDALCMQGINFTYVLCVRQSIKTFETVWIYTYIKYILHYVNWSLHVCNVTPICECATWDSINRTPNATYVL